MLVLATVPVLATIPVHKTSLADQHFIVCFWVWWKGMQKEYSLHPSENYGWSITANSEEWVVTTSVMNTDLPKFTPWHISTW